MTVRTSYRAFSLSSFLVRKVKVFPFFFFAHPILAGTLSFPFFSSFLKEGQTSLFPVIGPGGEFRVPFPFFFCLWPLRFSDWIRWFPRAWFCPFGNEGASGETESQGLSCGEPMPPLVVFSSFFFFLWEGVCGDVAINMWRPSFLFFVFLRFFFLRQ